MRHWFQRLRNRRAPAQVAPDAVQQSLARFEREFQIRFRDPRLLQQALTHRSYLGSNGGDPNLSNERMEFLGDAVLELIVIEHLYAHYPSEREGNLTKKKGLLVSRKVLADSAKWMQLGRYIFLSDAERGAGGETRTSILADAYEAVIGAIYLDQGLGAARRFIRKTLLTHADDILKGLGANWKSQLQELVQAHYRTHPRYRVVTEIGPDHRKLFTVEVSVRGELLGRGQGYNKKDAQQNSARDALANLESRSLLEPALEPPEDEAGSSK